MIGILAAEITQAAQNDVLKDIGNTSVKAIIGVLLFLGLRELVNVVRSKENY